MGKCVHAQSLTRVQLFATPRTVSSPPGSSVYGIFLAIIPEWVTISFSGDLPDPRIEPAFPALADGFFTTEPPESPSEHTELPNSLSPSDTPLSGYMQFICHRCLYWEVNSQKMSGQLGSVCVCNPEAVTVVIDDLPPLPSLAPALTLWILENMMGKNWYFRVLLTCVPLMMSEHISHVQWPFIVNFCESPLPSPSPPPIRLLVVFLLICKCSLYFREINPCLWCELQILSLSCPSEQHF